MRKLFPRVRFSRKQKIVRNLVLVLLCLFLTEWLLEFPALTDASLLRRVERIWLLENTELLFTAGEDDAGVLYGRNGDLLLTVPYGRTILGKQPGQSLLWEERDGIHCSSKDLWPLEIMAFGSLEDAARAEIEVDIHWEGSSGGRDWDTQRTYTAQGVRHNPYCFTFQLEPCFSEADTSAEAEMERAFFAGEGPGFTYQTVLRLYDGAGRMTAEKTMGYLEDVGLGWPEEETV